MSGSPTWSDESAEARGRGAPRVPRGAPSVGGCGGPCRDPPRQQMSKAALARMQAGVAYSGLGFLLVLVLFPFYWMTITSFKTEDQMRSLISMFWPSPAVLE